MNMMNVFRKNMVNIARKCLMRDRCQLINQKHFFRHISDTVDGARCVVGIDQWNEEFTKDIQKKIDKYWSTKISERRFDERSSKEKFYVLSMFPYPSGFLHMGHVRVYGLSDAIARYFRMKGKNVIHPMGWDAFGLPAENAALERQTHPDAWTQANIANMKSLLEEMNFSFDWDREFATCDSDYYKWTQFLFLKLFERGLVYRKEAFVNWDPVDKTVLADEQIDANGCSWRSGAKAEKKVLRQWFVKTTAFAKSLREGLKDPSLRGWNDVVAIQEHWIGEVNGTTLDFEIVDQVSGSERKRMPIWMTHPEHVDKAKFVLVKSKSLWTFGCDLEGLMPYGVKNPFTGEVLPVYQTDAVEFPENADTRLGIPELSEADRELADSFKIPYSLNLRNVAREEELIDLREKICAEARERGIGGYQTSSKLKDWLISRQRYWGTPIPIIHCEKCGEQPVPEKDLPIRLPKVKSIRKGVNSLKEEQNWITTVCPKCGENAVRETDTMDTFVDSSWYYLRFLDPDNEAAAFNVDKVKKLMPVDVYVGGKEHAALHLFYARFMNHFLHSVGLVPHREPFKQLLCQGMVKGMAYKSVKTGQYVSSAFVEEKDGDFFHKDSKEPVIKEWQKMSKSKHNSVEPRDLLAEYGVDTVRLVVLSGQSPKSHIHWSETRFSDILSWQRRLWLTVRNFVKLRSGVLSKPEATEKYKTLDYYIFDSRNFYLSRITSIIEESFDFATAIAKMQGLTNSLRKCNDEVIVHSVNFEKTLALQVILLAPIAPYFASELWAGFTKAPNRLCKNGEILWDKSVFEQPWPQMDADYRFRSDEIKDMVKLCVFKAKRQKRKKNAKDRILREEEKRENDGNGDGQESSGGDVKTLKAKQDKT